MQRSFDPHESWLMYQAKSYLGREVALDEAIKLNKEIDLPLRRPREQVVQRPAGIVAALRAMVGVGIVLFSISGCARDPNGPAQLESWTVQADQSVEQIGTFRDGFHNKIYKFYDLKERKVCYVVPTTYGVTMNCDGMKIQP